MYINKAHELTNAKISYVSLVDKAANKRKFLITKQEDGKASFSSFGKIIAKDADHHYVTGIVYEPMTEDAHGDFMTEEEIIKAAYWYSKNSEQVDLQHNFIPLENVVVVENWVAKADFEIDGQKVKKGTWLMTAEISDEDIWAAIEKGEITGFSMGGVADYDEEDKEMESVSKNEKKGLLKRLAEAMGLESAETVLKGQVADTFRNRQKADSFWIALNSLQSALCPYDGDLVSDPVTIQSCLEDFNRIITDILSEPTEAAEIAKELSKNRPVSKAGKKMSAKNRETLQGIYESLGTFLKEFDDQQEEEKPKEEDSGQQTNPQNPDEEKEEKPMTKQEVAQIIQQELQKSLNPGQANPTGQESGGAELSAESIGQMVREAIAKAQEPQQVTVDQVQEMIRAAVEPIFKSTGLPNNLNGDEANVQKQEQHYLHGIL